MNNKIKWSITIFLVISLVLGMFACKQEADSPAPNATEEVLSLGDLVALSADSMYSQVKESLAYKDAAYESLYGRSANPSVIRAGEEETTSTEPVTLKVLTWGGNLDYILEKFKTEYDNIEIEHTFADGVSAGSYSDIDGNYHDVVESFTSVEKVPHVAFMGLTKRHGENWKKWQTDIRHDLSKGTYHIGSFPRGNNGEIYFIPETADNLSSVVAINMDLLEQIGGKVPETYEDLVALAKLCKQNNIDCLSTYGGTDWLWGTSVFSPIIARTTGDANWVQKVAKGNAKFTDAGFVAALEAVKKYFDDDIFAENIFEILNGNNQEDDFIQGKCLMFLGGQWDIDVLRFYKDLDADGRGDKKGGPKVNFKLLPFLPVHGEKNNMRFCVSAAAANGYGITSAAVTDDSIKDAAIKFIEFANREEFIINNLDNGSLTGPIVQSLYNKSVDEFGTLVAQKMFILEKYKNVDVVDSYLPDEINGVLFTAVKGMVQNGKTATEVAQDVQTAYEAM